MVGGIAERGLDGLKRGVIRSKLPRRQHMALEFQGGGVEKHMVDAAIGVIANLPRLVAQGPTNLVGRDGRLELRALRRRLVASRVEVRIPDRCAGSSTQRSPHGGLAVLRHQLRVRVRIHGQDRGAAARGLPPRPQDRRQPFGLVHLLLDPGGLLARAATGTQVRPDERQGAPGGQAFQPHFEHPLAFGVEVRAQALCLQPVSPPEDANAVVVQRCGVLAARRAQQRLGATWDAREQPPPQLAFLPVDALSLQVCIFHSLQEARHQAPPLQRDAHGGGAEVRQERVACLLQMRLEGLPARVVPGGETLQVRGPVSRCPVGQLRGVA
mmetsp:Transcript_52469/g.159468  ORF Transcript_52469/g.159468 Transcript_52469/m.159468 type:complete len:326 (-) Transcript_52469:502-1479(-)